MWLGFYFLFLFLWDFLVGAVILTNFFTGSILSDCSFLLRPKAKFDFDLKSKENHFKIHFLTLFVAWRN